MKSAVSWVCLFKGSRNKLETSLLLLKGRGLSGGIIARDSISIVKLRILVVESTMRKGGIMKKRMDCELLEVSNCKLWFLPWMMLLMTLFYSLLECDGIGKQG